MIVGLGNPGTKYETTRHNVGWLALDRMIDDWKATGPKVQNGAEVWTTSVGGEKVLLVKPQTFMNLSGRAVGPLMQFYKCEPEDLVAIHDELDLAPAALRIKTGGGNGGHNGLKSLEEHLGVNTYHRIRIGIGHPRDFNPQMDVADWVLSRFSQHECEKLDPLLDRVRAATELLIAGEVKRAMNQFNASPKTDESEGK
jgi:peptidyl-tRNA hydrolase, PTH1 family